VDKRERIQMFLLPRGGRLKTTLAKYDFLEKVAKAIQKQGAEFLAFGLAQEEFRFVVNGNPEKVPNIVRGIKVGSTRESTTNITWAPSFVREDVGNDLFGALEWAHSLPLAGVTDPLENIWSSHRDLMGYRESTKFYDPEVISKSISGVHFRLGGRPRPVKGRPPKNTSLNTLLKIAGSVMGIPSGNRKCFGLFAQLAKEEGYPTWEIAHSLDLTDRRIRQLLYPEHPLLEKARVAMGDTRLNHVP